VCVNGVCGMCGVCVCVCVMCVYACMCVFVCSCVCEGSASEAKRQLGFCRTVKGGFELSNLGAEILGPLQE